MIYIKESFPDLQSVSLKVDGLLDDGSIPILKNLCQQHMEKGRRVFLDLKLLINVCRKGIVFLQQNQSTVTFVNLPPFIKLEKRESWKKE